MTIQVFEHQRLILDDVFKQHHLNAMLRFNDLHGNKYFTIVHRGVKFKNYVGVLQVGELTIEILPKVDKIAKGNGEEWRSVLLEMLRFTRSLKIETLSKAPLLVSQQSLLDIYLFVFLGEVKKILRQGLVKEYQWDEKQRKSLKGQVQFQQHISKNLVHRERFYTKHQEYTTDYILHQIIACALKVVHQTTTHSTISSQSHQLLKQFSSISTINIQPKLFSNIRLTRKNAHYQSVLDLAQLILMNYCPDLKSGQFDILAILLDMNQLFERYIFEALRKVVHQRNMSIQGQPIRPFWEEKTSLRPDIFLQKANTNYILDTKWKALLRQTPDSEDLKQMFVYGHYFKAAKSVLIYPKTHHVATSQEGIFHQKMYDEEAGSMVEQSCDLVFVEVMKDGKLNGQIGEDILKMLV